MKNLLLKYVTVFDVKDHDRMKEEVVSLLNGSTQKTGPLMNSVSDWNNNNLNEQYQQIVNKYLLPYFDQYCTMINHERFKIDKQWFVDYKEGNVGTAWHGHACQFSSVYYLHLDNAGDRTQFRDTKVPFAEEGNLIIFPSFLVHRSPKVKGRKIIVSTNFNVDGSSHKPIDL